MTDFARYRAVAALGRIESLSHALWKSLSEGHDHGAEGVLDTIGKDLEEARKAVQPVPETAPHPPLRP